MLAWVSWSRNTFVCCHRDAGHAGLGELKPHPGGSTFPQQRYPQHLSATTHLLNTIFKFSKCKFQILFFLKFKFQNFKFYIFKISNFKISNYNISNFRIPNFKFEISKLQNSNISKFKISKNPNFKISKFHNSKLHLFFKLHGPASILEYQQTWCCDKTNFIWKIRGNPLPEICVRLFTTLCTGRILNKRSIQIVFLQHRQQSKN